MNNLLKDVTLFCGPGVTRNGLIELSSGSEPCDGEVVGSYEYEAPSFKPKLPWRSPAAEEASVIFTDDPASPLSKTVAIVKMPGSIRQLVEELGISDMQTHDDHVLLKKNNAKKYMNFTDLIRSEAENYLASTKKLHNIGILTENNLGRRTSTVNRNTQKLIGMHMDSWEGMTVADLNTAPNRICLNLGKEDRFFLFVNLTMETVFELAGNESGLDRQALSQDLLTIQFFRHFPQYPVIKVRVKPFEAYIAPTENVIHDACSEQKVHTDVNYTIRGYFNVSKKNTPVTV